MKKKYKTIIFLLIEVPILYFLFLVINFLYFFWTLFLAVITFGGSLQKGIKIEFLNSVYFIIAILIYAIIRLFFIFRKKEGDKSLNY